MFYSIKEIKKDCLNNMEEIKIKIVRPIEIEWECPECHKINHDFFYNVPGTTRLQCDYCGNSFIWR